MKLNSIEELTNLLNSHPHWLPQGGKTKPALAACEDGFPLEMSGISGILEYQPSEYTFTALAGTRLDLVEEMLAQHGQFMPFDPPLVEKGATLGGTIAAGLSGSGRYRYGGVRDFLLGVQFIDGKGQMVRAGGKVVKNAAGFDIPKLMVGSLGSLGAITEVSFKVFPRPGAYATVKNTFSSLDQSLEKLIELTATPIDLFCLDLAPISDGFEMILRIGGLPECFPERYQRLQTLLGGGEIIEGESDINLWRQVREFTWLPQNSALIKVPLTPKLVSSLDYYLAENGAVRRYCVGANLAWIGWSGELDSLDQKLNELKLSGLILFGTFERTRIGIRTGDSFYRRVKTALDPHGLWLEV